MNDNWDVSLLAMRLRRLETAHATQRRLLITALALVIGYVLFRFLWH